jgi:hypothetical protein
MIEITNRKRWPVQLVIRSKERTSSFTCLNVPGIGGGNNVRLLADERKTDYVDRAEQDGLISTRQVPDKLSKGE